ncbi:MAG: M15 family metallopeptidase [Acetobacteraceae bacterium]|nr:M15 family metallopeptidase [Pseudomonadota bacterium]
MKWLLVAVALLIATPVARAASMQDLVQAYPDFLAGFDGSALLWRDGTRMPVDDGRPDKTPEEALRHGSIADQMRLVYPVGAPVGPAPEADPGRVRNTAFFDKMYGDCSVGDVTPRLVRVPWLPKSLGKSVTITSVNGVDKALAAVSRELDDMPADYRRYLWPLGGTYACRAVADTGQRSVHAWGAAIDVNPKYAAYWYWRRGAGYENRIPAEIVAVFERHGFIWGGRWAHYDTMHFEYRPELTGYLPGRE